LRPVQGENEPAPFPSWTYGPKYLPGGVPPYEISQRSRVLEEPFIFFTPAFSRPDRYPAERRQPLTHGNGVRQLTCIHLESPRGTLPDLRSSRTPANLLLHRTPRHRLQVTFDHARQGHILQLSTLPVTLSW
jgi:hypothetical protein